MALLRTTTEWHDIRIDPDDLPDEGDPILVTIEQFDGTRKVWLDAFLEESEDGDHWFVTEAINGYGRPEKTVIWYPVVAWAYPPDPYNRY